tara:strand:- start:1481 stop:1651 length:171 start_codon:yes stop_codon:yes gene_type:complete
MSIKRFKVIYTELPYGSESNTEIKDEVILQTDDIQWSIDQFMRNRYIIDYKIIALK